MKHLCRNQMQLVTGADETSRSQCEALFKDLLSNRYRGTRTTQRICSGDSKVPCRPYHTYDKVIFDPWDQQTFDVNDTVLQTDPASDLDVSHFFLRLPNTDYSPTWYALRTDPAYATEAAQL